jgi:hypothetical protein
MATEQRFSLRRFFIDDENRRRPISQKKVSKARMPFLLKVDGYGYNSFLDFNSALDEAERIYRENRNEQDIKIEIYLKRPSTLLYHRIGGTKLKFYR